MRVLVTGGAGYIGSGLIKELAQNTAIVEIVIYDNLSRGNLGLFLGNEKLHGVKVSFIHGDILDGRKLKSALKNIDIVYHLAASVTSPNADQNPQQFEQVNHWGTAELVRAIEQSGVTRLIYLSTVSVYGWSDEELTEEAVLEPNTYYGVSKMRGEEQVLSVKNEIETFIVRCGNVFGYSPSMRKDTVINSFMFNAQYSNRIKVMGNGSQMRSFVSLSSVVDQLSQLVNNKKVTPGVYNLVDHNISILDLADLVKSLYPELETIFVNQHLTMRQVIIKQNTNFYFGNRFALKDELKAFKSKFIF
jgi:UDP-glucose 4-epimerase